jgi:hypothetical protein
MKTVAASTLNVHSPKSDPCRALWCAVIQQAFMDAAWHPVEGQHKNTIARGIDTRRARHWFMFAPDDFRLVCEYAGFNFSYVQRKYHESFYNGLFESQKKLAHTRATTRGAHTRKKRA